MDSAVGFRCNSSSYWQLVGLTLGLCLTAWALSPGHCAHVESEPSVAATLNNDNPGGNVQGVSYHDAHIAGQAHPSRLPVSGGRPREIHGDGSRSPDYSVYGRQEQGSSLEHQSRARAEVRVRVRVAPRAGDGHPRGEPSSYQRQKNPPSNRMVAGLPKTSNVVAFSGEGGNSYTATVTSHRVPLTSQQTHGSEADGTRASGSGQIRPGLIRPLANPQLRPITRALEQSPLVFTLLKQSEHSHDHFTGGEFGRQSSLDGGQKGRRAKRWASTNEGHDRTLGNTVVSEDEASTATLTEQAPSIHTTAEAPDTGPRENAALQNETIGANANYSDGSEKGLRYRSMVGLVDFPGLVDNTWGRQRGRSDGDTPVGETEESHTRDATERWLDRYKNDPTEATTVEGEETRAGVLRGGKVSLESRPMTGGPEANGTTQGEAALEQTEGPMPEPEMATSAKMSGPEPEPEAEVEPDWTPEGKAEWTSEAEPDQVEVHDADSCNPCLAEPEPNWPVAKMEWQVAWEVHVYGVGILFAVLATYSFLSIVRLFGKKNLLGQSHFVASNGMLLVMGSCRALFFLVDGYNAKRVFHPVAAYLLYNVGFPCLTSAFSVLFLALLQALQVQVLSPKIQRLPVLVALIAVHFVLSLLTGLVMGFLSGTKLMVLICQVAFVAWGLFLFCGYVYVFKSLHLAAVRRQKDTMQMMMTKSDSEFNAAALKPKIQVKFPLNVATVVTMMSAAFGLACTGLHLYGIVGAYSILSRETPKAWPWWGFMLGLRIAELCMCATMSFVATQPFRYRIHPETSSSGTDCWTVVSVMPCCRLCDTGRVEDDKTEWNSSFDGVFQDLGSSGSSSGSSSRDRTASVRYSETTEETSALHNCQTPDGEPSFVEEEIRKSASWSRKPCKRKRRPRSMLVYENGFIRFRHEGDPEGEPVASTDDELDSVDLNGRSSQREGNGAVQWSESGARGPWLVPQNSCRNSSSGVTTPGTPATPRSFASADFDGLSDAFSFKAPSSIHLRESIERALDDTDSCHRFSLRTPDFLDCDLDTYYSVPNTPDSVLDADRSFQSLDELSRISFQCQETAGDTPSHGFNCRTSKSPKCCRSKVQSGASSLQSLNQRLATMCAHLDDADGLVLRRKLQRLHRYRSKGGLQTELPLCTDGV